MVTENAFSHKTFVENTSVMKMFVTLIIVGIATVLLMVANTFISHIPLQLHTHSYVNALAKYQVFALSVGVITMIAILILKPESRQILGLGQLGTIAEKEKWLGISGKSSWAVNGLQLLFTVSLATGIFMFLAVKSTGSIDNFQWSIMPIVLLFSCTNSLAEELIFRFGIVGGLFGHHSKFIVLFVSAILFGLPHYMGFPNGFVGVIMAGVLGYILCKATVETKGLSIAWAIHFVQDMIIFTALMMINVKPTSL